LGSTKNEGLPEGYLVKGWLHGPGPVAGGSGEAVIGAHGCQACPGLLTGNAEKVSMGPDELLDREEISRRPSRPIESPVLRWEEKP
jgi:hypothetical protein